jgi:N-acyl-D-amino-acid deacylase
VVDQSLLIDGRPQAEIREGVTAEIFAEGSSMGPMTPEMKQRALKEQGDEAGPRLVGTCSAQLERTQAIGDPVPPARPHCA